MSKVGYASLKAECSKLGFELSKTPANVYRITVKGDREPAFCGNFEDCWAFQLGLSYMHQQLTPPILGDMESMIKYWGKQR